jgi:hypothetical protein
MFEELSKYLGSTSREPEYTYGNILPYRAKLDEKGKAIPGTVDWGLGYSNAAKSMFDTLLAPRQAMQGQSFTPEQAMNFAANVTAPGAATARYSPGMFNMPMVYHGTPYKFEPTPDNPLGEFRASQIGTGEGAQAYGHGLYLAESPKVADTYRKNLQGGPIGIKIMEAAQKALGTRYDEAASSSQFIDGVRAVAGQGADAVRDAIVKTAKRMAASQWPGDKRLADRVRALADNPAVVKAVNEEAAGSLYTADLPDEMVDRMLDWDKPLSEQPDNVKKALEPLVREALKKQGTPEGYLDYHTQRKKGGDIRELLRFNIGDRAFSEKMKELGIPGIKYFDASSRDVKEGTRNFVLFPGEEKKAKIIKRD